MSAGITGFVRDMMIAAVLGSCAVADACIAAFLLPNLFRPVLSEGAFNAAFVPIHARRAASEGEASVRDFAESAFAAVVAAAAIAALAAEVAMPAITAARAPGFDAQSTKFADAVTFAPIDFLFVAAVVVVAALMSSVLNALGRLALAALAPLLLDILLIGALTALLLLGWRESRAAGVTLVFTVLAAGLAQFALVAWSLRRAGHVIHLRRPHLDGDVRLLTARILPGLLLVGAGHLNLVVAAQFSSSLPEVARALGAEDHDPALASCLLLVLPAALAFAVLAGPIGVAVSAAVNAGVLALARSHGLRLDARGRSKLSNMTLSAIITVGVGQLLSRLIGVGLGARGDARPARGESAGGLRDSRLRASHLRGGARRRRSEITGRGAAPPVPSRGGAQSPPRVRRAGSPQATKGGLAKGVPSRPVTSPPASGGTASPAAMSHSIVRPRRGQASASPLATGRSFRDEPVETKRSTSKRTSRAAVSGLPCERLPTATIRAGAGRTAIGWRGAAPSLKKRRRSRRRDRAARAPARERHRAPADAGPAPLWRKRNVDKASAT